MRLLVPRITDAAMPKDLRESANGVIESWFRWPFSEIPQIVSCRILPVADSMWAERRHGVLDVTAARPPGRKRCLLMQMTFYRVYHSVCKRRSRLSHPSSNIGDIPPQLVEV